jgi:hypothetical protein
MMEAQLTIERWGLRCSPDHEVDQFAPYMMGQ